MVEYEEVDAESFVIDERGDRLKLANFIARIVEEVRYVDGRMTETILTIVGNNSEMEFPDIKIAANEFSGMSWVLPEWGVQAIISPGSRIKDDLRAMIQSLSDPIRRTVYRKIGWQDMHGRRVYLHAGGAITANGNDASVTVDLPHELEGYELTVAENPVESVQASLALCFLGPPDVMFPLLAGTLTPLYGPVDFAIHVTGRTGTFKSELMALLQSHYGKGMDSRHLPGSWSSTANALEAQAYYAANAAFVIDDFVPSGTAWQVRSYQTNADKILRAQGNQSGRARLTDTSRLQTTMYPRGIILSTGEDTPEGHSVRARMMILELNPGDIKTSPLTKAQKNRDKYSGTTAALIQHLAEFPADLTVFSEEIRDQNLDLGHSRTPSMVGRLTATMSHFLEWAEAIEAISSDERRVLEESSLGAIKMAGEKQTPYLESADPIDGFIAALRHVLGANLGHFRTLHGGIPKKATDLGWTSEQGLSDDMPMFKAHGPLLGWVSWTEDAMFLDGNAGFNIVKKHATEVSLSKQTLIKRLKDGGLLTRIDDNRQRNTIRITTSDGQKQVLVLMLSTILDSGEKLDD